MKIKYDLKKTVKCHRNDCIARTFYGEYDLDGYCYISVIKELNKDYSTKYHDVLKYRWYYDEFITS